MVATQPNGAQPEADKGADSFPGAGAGGGRPGRPSGDGGAPQTEAADAAMYESKHAGRNRVSLSPMRPNALGISIEKLAPQLS